MIQDIIKEAFKIGMYQQPEEIHTFADFLSLLKLRNVMEIGTQDGGTFYLWTQLSDPEGIKITLDLPNGPYSTRGQTEEQIAARDERIRSWGKNTHVLNADSHDQATVKQVAQILKGEKLDFLFIDGDHRYEGVARDFSNYQEFMNQGGIIAFHDIASSEWHASVGCFVSLLWAQLKTHFPVTYEFGPYENWGGIGAVHVGLETYPPEIQEFVENFNAKIPR